MKRTGMKAKEICKPENVGKEYNHRSGISGEVAGASCGLVYPHTRHAIQITRDKLDGWEPVAPELAVDERIKNARCPQCGRAVKLSTPDVVPADPHVYCPKEARPWTPAYCWGGLLSECAPAPTVTCENCTIESAPTQRVEEWEVKNDKAGLLTVVTRSDEFECFLADIVNRPRWQGFYIYKLPDGARHVSPSLRLAWHIAKRCTCRPECANGHQGAYTLLLPVAVPMLISEGT